MNVLNLYSGLGGNRKLWERVQVTSVEQDTKIAGAYKVLHPDDTLVIGDAHQYLLDHHDEFDFIWSSPPCQTHSRMVKATRHKHLRRYPEVSLYQEILFLQHFARCPWVVENVVPYYDPLIPPTFRVGRHLFWASCKPAVDIIEPSRPKGFITAGTAAETQRLKDWLGIQYEGNLYYKGNHCPGQVLRNCVHPEIGKQVFDQVSTHP